MQASPPKHLGAKPRAMHIVLRDGGHLSASVFIAVGQALAPFLSSRKGGWLNVTRAQWEFEGIVHPHAVVRDDDIAWMRPVEPDVAVSMPGTVGESHDVDVLLEDRSCIRGRIVVAAGQRFSDYLAAGGRFLPLNQARAADTGEEYGDIAINFEHVKAVRHVFALESDTAGAAAKQAQWEKARKSIEARERETARRPTTDATPVAAAPPSPEEVRSPDRLAVHWLVRIARDAGLLPPDIAEVGPEVTLPELWRAIAGKNDVSDAEIAVLVSTMLRLPRADISRSQRTARDIVPAKVARRLGVIPLQADAASLTVATAEPGSLELEQQLRFVTRLQLKLEVAAPSEIAEALEYFYPAEATPPARATKAR